MGTLDIKNFPAHGVSDEDTFLMTDAKNGFVAGSMTLKDMKERVIVPLVEALSLDYELLTQAEYDAVEKKKEGTLYAIEEDGKLVRTYIGSLPLTVGGSLGSLDNVDETADHAGREDVVLIRAKGSGTWTLKRLSEIGGGGGGTGVQRNVRIVNNLDSKNILASKGEPCLLNFTFVSQERYADSEPYEDTGERGLLQISVRNGDHSDYLAVKQVYVNSASPVALDVAEFLSSGANNVMIKVTGEVTEITTPAFVYTVQLTALSIFADNFRWWTAYLGAIILPLNIGGNIAKTLHVSMSGKDYNESYEVAIGTNVYIETAYNYTIPHPGKTGVFRVSAYVGNSDESIKTKTVAFNIICAVAGERVKLIAVNNVLEKATNWVENTLFDYAMYDGDSVSTFARFVIMKEGQQVFSSNENSIAVSTKHTFSLPLEIDTLDNSEFSIQVEVLDESVALTSPLVFPVNNSLGYSAVAGATLYVNPRTRNNRQENYREVVNEMNGTAIAAGWKNMNWGNDGWVPDSDGNRVLRLMAGSSLAMAYYPFARECARVGKTLEIDYRVDHVTDYSKPIVTISTPDGVSFTGLNIYADQIVMHSQSLREDSVQSLHTFEGKRTRFTLTILPMAYGNPDFNLCILYINGVKNREFAYEDNDYFAQRGGIVIGSDCADVDIYGIREYDSGLTSQGVLTNYINWLSDSAEKARVRLYNDILDGNGSEVDFDNTRDQFNCLVFDNTIPSMADQTARVGNLDVLFTDHPEWNVSISGVTAKGQGTSSMKYWIWNTRYQLDKAKSVITHADGTTSTKKWQMVPWIPAGQKFTAKKNFASSMQSHKIGSVNAYNDLYREVGLRNEAMETEQYADARVAVYQMPFVCFEKSVNEEGRTVYTFRGLYTFGPDKGDKYTFGFDTDLFPNLISIEGSDNSPLCTLFRVPWNNNVFYNSDEEAFQYNGANSWDAGEGKVESISKFIPAYNIVYECSPRLLPFDGTPEELNEQAAAMRTRPCEFWIAKAGDGSRFDVFYFEASLNRFIPSDTGKGVMNLVTQLVDKGYGLSAADLSGKTNDELNALFVNARIAKFRAEAPLYWDVDDTLFFMNNVEFNAGTDERAKNTYPYSFGTETSRFRWRVDDADTRFDTTNRGLPNKEYSVETHDTDETGASIWNGETNNFFNLMELAFPEEKVASMRGMMTAMQSLGGLKSGNDLEKIYAFYQKYFFDEAQEYFPANSYNADARYCYENGKLAYRAGIYSNDTDPITQSLGDHYQAEQRWITKRILYMMSKYSFGLFSAAGTDTITVRAAGNTITYDLTPAMDMYPAIANGTSIIRAGETCSMVIELSGTGDQQNAIQGASYLQDIGDWYDKNVQGSMVIQGRMLREIRLGSKTGHIVISITSLTISNCTSLQKLVLSNIATLSGTLNLTSCTHLQEVYADGTSLSQMKLPTGGSMRVIEFSPRNQYLSLSNYPLLPTEGVRMDQCKHIITDFFVEDCPLLHPVELLVEVMEAQKQQGTEHALKRVRVVGFNETYNSSDILDKLASLADGSYEGLSSEGIAGEDPVPVLDGTLNIHADAYEDSINALRSKFNRLVLNITGNYYVRFKDPEFHRLVVKRWSTDGVGVTRKQLAAVTDFPNDYFKDNKEITDLSDFANNFVNVNLFKQRTFENCTGLKTISLPSEKIDTSAIAIFGHTSLDENGIDLSCLTTLGFGIFRDCRFVHVFIPNTLLLDMDYSQQWQDNLRLLTMELEEGLSVVPNSLCSGCRLLTTIIFPSTITTIGGSVVHGCNNLKNFICKPITPPALVSDLGYIYTDFNIYVPDESVEIYKIAWTKYESKIKPMSQKPENV